MTTTVIAGPVPPEVEVFLERRRQQGLDERDECWGGRYYVAPPADIAHGIVASELNAELRARARALGLRSVSEFNLGTGPQNYAVPDGGVLPGVTGVYAPTAALVVEVLSPDDATFDKFAHYAAHGVGEVVVADPRTRTRTVRCWQLREGSYVETARSQVLDVAATELAAAIAWP